MDFCPLTKENCKRNKCEWRFDGHCAIYIIAGYLNDINCAIMTHT